MSKKKKAFVAPETTSIGISTFEDPDVVYPENETPVEDDGNELPVEDDGNELPVEEGGYDRPVEEGGNDYPVEEDGSDYPVEEDGGLDSGRQPEDEAGDTDSSKEDFTNESGCRQCGDTVLEFPSLSNTDLVDYRANVIIDCFETHPAKM